MMDYHYYIFKLFAWYKVIRLYILSSSLVEPGLSRHSVVTGDNILYKRKPGSLSIMQFH
jgi:sulfur relay (sulfurtransferase) DsrF/TusC family protein